MKRFFSWFRYSIGIWFILPLLEQKEVGNYGTFFSKGLAFALVLSTLFYFLDRLVDRILIKPNGKK